MLVLTRKRGQKILIGPSIIVTVVGSTGKNVQLGIEAPREVRVLRDELDRKPTRHTRRQRV